MVFLQLFVDKPSRAGCYVQREIFFLRLGLKPPTELKDTNWGRESKEGTQNSSNRISRLSRVSFIFGTRASAQQIIVAMATNST